MINSTEEWTTSLHYGHCTRSHLSSGFLRVELIEFIPCKFQSRLSTALNLIYWLNETLRYCVCEKKSSKQRKTQLVWLTSWLIEDSSSSGNAILSKYEWQNVYNLDYLLRNRNVLCAYQRFRWSHYWSAQRKWRSDLIGQPTLLVCVCSRALPWLNWTGTRCLYRFRFDTVTLSNSPFVNFHVIGIQSFWN